MTKPEVLTIGAFFDIENMAMGSRFKVELVLDRLIEKGNVIVKKAYADWRKVSSFKRAFHEVAIELIDMPGSKAAGKNSADIKMVVDALDYCYTKPHINTFALVTGDSDFSPLVSKLRENGKHVIGIGIKESTSHLLIDNCDEFVFYDDLTRPRKRKRRRMSNVSEKKSEAFDQLIEAASALQRMDRTLHGSLLKDTMRRKQPQFNEEYHGYSSFGALLEDAQKHGLIELRRDSRSGTYVVDSFEEG